MVSDFLVLTFPIDRATFFSASPSCASQCTGTHYDPSLPVLMCSSRGCPAINSAVPATELPISSCMNFLRKQCCAALISGYISGSRCFAVALRPTVATRRRPMRRTPQFMRTVKGLNERWMRFLLESNACGFLVLR